MRTFLFEVGSRVLIRRGHFPMNPGLIGRPGLVVLLDEHRPKRYGVVLDGETIAREFAEDELECPGALEP